MRRIMILTTLFLLLHLSSCTQVVQPPPMSPEQEQWRPPYIEDFDSEVLVRDNLHLFDYDPEAPLDIEQVEQWRGTNTTWYDLTYGSPKGGRVPATLVVPDGEGPFAGLVLMHGMPSERQNVYHLARAYAALGTVIIMIDAPFARPNREGQPAVSFTSRDREDQIQLITDLRRAVDLLISRPEVDPTRLAYLGVSYGGAMGGLLAGVEDRLAAYVLQVGDGGLVTHSTGLDDVDSSFQDLSADKQMRWVEAMWPIEPIHYVSHAAPAELLYMNGTQDALVPPADALRYQSAGSDPKTILWYEAGHRLPLKAMRNQVAWLESRIGLVNLEDAIVNLIVMDPIEIGVLFIPEMRPSALLIDRVLLTWFLLTAASLVILLWDLAHAGMKPLGVVLMWSLTIVFFGPVGLLAYALAYRAAERAVQSVCAQLWRRGLGVTVWSVSANLLGGFVVITLVKAYPTIGENILLVLSTLILPPLITAAAIFRFVQLGLKSEEESDFVVRRSWVAEFIATNATLAGSYPVVLFLIERWLDPWYGFVWNLATPALWGVLMLGAIAGAVTAYPFQIWMLRRDLVLWGWKASQITETAVPGEGIIRARWLDVVVVTVLSFVLLIGLVWITYTLL